ncbi:MAG: bifunctional oligoribonuclease/PAP phosphatase NrnA [Lachnospiraceae bacterium]
MKLDEILKGAQVIGISGHVRPDGDCVGSTLALYQYIRFHYPEKEVTLYLEEIPDALRCLPYTEEMEHEPEENKHFDLYFALDCGDLSRLGKFAVHWEHADHTVCIDHHKSNLSFGEENLIDANASSTCELVFQCMDPKGMNREIAMCLYLGIVHDTGVFQYSCTSKKTMEIAGTLMEYGFDTSQLIDKTYYEKTIGQNRIQAKAVLYSELYCEGQVICSCINTQDLQEFHVGTKDLDGIVNQLRITKGVEVAVFLYETGEKEYKVSLRSKKLVDVSEIAVLFGGGGHVRAAGVTMTGTKEEILTKLIPLISERLVAK